MVGSAERPPLSMPEANHYPSIRLRLLLGFLIIGHLWAVLARPIEFATQGPGGASPAAIALHAPVKGYSEFAYLNHGYAFFAPDPGPSHLLRVRVSGEGEEAAETFPDLSRQWPRLLYHRHFMLTEFLHNVYAPPIPDALDDEVPSDDPWRGDRTRYEAIRDSMRRHIQASRGLATVDVVEIERVEHRMPFLDEYLEERVRLNSERLYRTLDDAFPMEEPGDGDPEPPSRLQAEPTSPDRSPMIVPPGRGRAEMEGRLP